MTATPRTDAVSVRGVNLGDCATVTADFARELETENSALRTALEAIADSYISPKAIQMKARAVLSSVNSATAAEIPELIEPGDLKDTWDD